MAGNQTAKSKKRSVKGQNNIAHPLDATGNTADTTTTVSEPIVDAANNAFRLMDLPIETRQDIFALAVATSEPITPFQVKYRSNKFFWSKSQMDARDSTHHRQGTQDNVYGSPDLTVVQLSKVSKQVYTEVVRTHIFYRVNQFEFLTNSDLLAYLVAITPDRLRTIRSIKTVLALDLSSMVMSAHVYTLLAACKGLQNLELVLSWRDFHYTRGIKQRDLPGISELFVAARGLQSISVTFVSKWIPSFNPLDRYATLEEEKLAVEQWCKELEDVLRDPSFQEGHSCYSVTMFEEAQIAARLDFTGNRRVSYDPKEGAVAYRTRSQIRNLENVDPDGRIQRPADSKYDLNGGLNWYVNKVLRSRKTDDGIYGIEFQVESTTYTDGKYSKRLEPIYREDGHLLYRNPFPYSNRWKVKSWENISALTSIWNRDLICKYYKKHPNAQGKKLVLDTWSLEDGVDQGDEDENMITRCPLYRVTPATFTAQLNEMITAEDIRRKPLKADSKAKAIGAKGNKNLQRRRS